MSAFEFPPAGAEMVAGETAHYSAADTGSLTIVSNKVSQWNDLSGNGHNLTQATAGSRPLYDATPRTMNGIICPEFTGAGEFMESTMPMDDRTCSIYIAMLLDSIAGNKCPIGDTQGGGLELRIGGSAMNHLKSGVAVLATSTLAFTNVRLQLYCSRLNATHHFFNYPGDFESSTAEATTFTAGRTLRVGKDTSGTILMDGLIGEMIFYSTTHTVDEVSQNFAYLAGVWA